MLDLHVGDLASQLLDERVRHPAEDHVGALRLLRRLRQLLQPRLDGQALRLRLQIGLVLVHDLLCGDLPLLFEPQDPRLHAVVLQGNRRLLNLLAKSAGFVGQPGQCLAGALHLELKVVLGVRRRDGVGDVRRQRRIRLLNGDQHQPRVPSWLHRDPGLQRAVGREVRRSLPELHGLDRLAQHGGALHDLVLRRIVVRIPRRGGPERRHLGKVQELRRLRIDHDRRRGPVDRNLLGRPDADRKDGEQEDPDDQPPVLAPDPAVIEGRTLDESLGGFRHIPIAG